MAKYNSENGLRVGYSVEDGIGEVEIDPRLPLLQDADLRDKVVLLRVDHNVVKKGKILDQYRIDVTLPTMYNIVERGGRPIIMTHIGRPYDKKTKTIYLWMLLLHIYNGNSISNLKFPASVQQKKNGILDIDTSINWLIHDLKSRKIGGTYLPNSRWFAGEEDKGDKLNRFVIQLSALADVYVNDAFGSWQPHGSTYHIAKYLPSYAGLCMQGELYHVQSVLNPSKPFVAIVAGAKYDTKIGPLKEIYKKVDKLVLGGLIYNTYLCAKYGVKISGVEESDIELAKELVVQDKVHRKILELQVLVETNTLEGRFEGKFRTIDVKDFALGQTYKYVVDVDPVSFERDEVKQEMNSAKTIFVNVVMGLMPHFWHGTSKMDEVIDKNRSAQKFFGGGDTLQTFKSLHPALYEAALNNVKYYLFTRGGTVLKVIEEGDPMGLETVKALIDNKANYFKRSQNN